MNQDMNSMVPGIEKKKSKAPILIISILVIIIGVGLYLFFGTDLFKKDEVKPDNNKQQEQKEEEKKEEKKEKEKQSEQSTSSISGKYEHDGESIFLFEKSSKVVMLEYENGDIALDVTDEGLKYGSFDEECRITINGDEITIKSNNMDGLTSGVYKKTKEYTKEDYFDKHIGNSEYINSKYNVQYKNGSKTVDIFQLDKNEVRVNLVSQDNDGYIGYEHDFTIQTDGSLKEDNSSTITIDGDTIMVSLADREYSSKFDGTYKKSKDLTIDYILENYN